MEKKLTVDYYEEGDELNVLVGPATEALYVEVADDVYLRLDPKSKEVLGFTIVNFRAHGRTREPEIPVVGHFRLPLKTERRLKVS
jgi:hypothetical protein